ncbi:YraN family protein [Rhodococcus aerolatus]
MAVEQDAGAAREDPRHVLGRRGEDVAVAHLTDAGLVVLDRNWRCRAGELDVVATDGSTLVVVEVKTRSGTGYGTPAESVTDRKLTRMRRLAHLWLAEHRVGWVEVRFDVVAVLARPGRPPEVEHLVGVF